MKTNKFKIDKSDRIFLWWISFGLLLMIIGAVFSNTKTKNINHFHHIILLKNKKENSFSSSSSCFYCSYPCCSNNKQILLTKKDSILNKKNVFKYIQYLNIYYDTIVFKQILLETGNLNCTNCSLDYNNLFGFRYNNKYIKFQHWKESIRYYANWQYRKYQTKINYYDFLIKVGYAEDKEYINKLKTIRVDGNGFIN